MGKTKSKCCKKFRKKGRACSSCPLMAGLCKRERRELIAGLGKGRKKKGKAA